jgi:hypothetical protein
MIRYLNRPPVARKPAIRCELMGSDTARAGELIARGTSPVFDLCRKLLAAGADPESPLECFRGRLMSLRVKSIGAGAGLTIRETATDGPRIVRWKAFPDRALGPPIGKNGQRSPQHMPTVGARAVSR